MGSNNEFNMLMSSTGNEDLMYRLGKFIYLSTEKKGKRTSLMYKFVAKASNNKLYYCNYTRMNVPFKMIK